MNFLQNLGRDLVKKFESAPTTEQFLKNGQLSPMEFEKAGDKLVDTIGGWNWRPSLTKVKSKYLP